MIVSEKTEANILKAMEHGAVLCIHWKGFYGWDGWESYISHISLNHGEAALSLDTEYRRDEYHFVPCDEDGAHWLRHGEHSRLASASQLAQEIIKRPDVRDDYLPGSRGDASTRWVERYVHISKPQPRWVTEQWGFDEFGNPDGDYSVSLE